MYERNSLTLIKVTISYSHVCAELQMYIFYINFQLHIYAQLYHLQRQNKAMTLK